jgi:fibronectin type 3 domain-containing protein
MKPARPWMLAHLKIIWQFHKKVSRFFVPRYIGDDFFLGPNLVSFNRSFIRVIIPYEISKVNFRVETKILVSMSEEI